MRNGIISYRVAFTQAKNSIPPARLIKNVLNAKWYHFIYDCSLADNAVIFCFTPSLYGSMRLIRR